MKDRKLFLHTLLISLVMLLPMSAYTVAEARQPEQIYRIDNTRTHIVEIQEFEIEEEPAQLEAVEVELEAETQPLVIQKDVSCVAERQWDTVEVGYVLSGTEIEPIEEEGDKILIESERHGNQQCWIDSSSLEPVGFINPYDLHRTIRWETLVKRYLPEFEETLNVELVLSVIYKESHGSPKATDSTGLDVLRTGHRSVGLMQAIPRPEYPCYNALTGPDAFDSYDCQILLGMTILHNSILEAHKHRTGDDLIEYSLSADVVIDSRCTRVAGGTELIGYILGGTSVEGVRAIKDDTGELWKIRIYSQVHNRFCWLSVEDVTNLEFFEPDSSELDISEEDVRLGLQAYVCSLESALEDNCLSWGGDTYSNLVMDTILPEISQALGEH